MNNLLLLLSAAAMIGAAIWNTHQALVLRGINKRLAGVVKNLEKDLDSSENLREERDGALGALARSAMMITPLHANIQELEAALREAETACDEWEVKNGDAPHRCVKLADRIRLNAGLYP
jgi:hypothetical protein